MAQPIFSFKNSTEKIRYYFTLNTYGDLPQSIPMDIISFLNYMRFRVDNYENFTRIFHQIYPELVETGSSLDSIGFDDLSHPLRKQLIAISELRYNITGDALFFKSLKAAHKQIQDQSQLNHSVINGGWRPNAAPPRHPYYLFIGVNLGCFSWAPFKISDKKSKL